MKGVGHVSATPEFSYLRQAANLKNSLAKCHWHFSPSYPADTMFQSLIHPNLKKTTRVFHKLGRVRRIELPSSVPQTDVLTVELHPPRQRVMVVSPHCQQNKFPGTVGEPTKPLPLNFENPLAKLVNYINRGYSTMHVQILIVFEKRITVYT